MAHPTLWLYVVIVLSSRAIHWTFGSAQDGLGLGDDILGQFSETFEQLVQGPSCTTVGGPNPFAPCVFPFTYRGVTYTYCPVDPEDPTKTWCSTFVDSDGNHVADKGQYGHCDANCPQSPNSPGGSKSLAACFTVSGPNPNRPCVFPFIHEGATHFGCPVDPDDPTKRWCSTMVDSSGRHVTGQNEYGHCSSACPLEGASSSSSGQSQGRACGNSAGGRCMAPLECPAIQRDRASQCQLYDGSLGLCCTPFSDGRSSFGLLPSISARSGSEAAADDSLRTLSNQLVRSAFDIGQGVLDNVTRFTSRSGLAESSSEFLHFKNQQPLPGTESEAASSIVQAVAASALRGALESKSDVSIDTVGLARSFSGNDNTNLNFGISDSTLRELNDCPNPGPCFGGGNKFRNLDGSCNNLREPKFGQAKTPLRRILPNQYDDGVLLPKLRNLPNARVVSSTVVDRFNSMKDSIYSTMLMVVGQFLDHDLDHVPVRAEVDCCKSSASLSVTESVVCFPITVSPNDPVYGGSKTCMNFVRSTGSPSLDCQPGPLEQMNQISHWLDSSNVYGSSKNAESQLRDFSGLLRTSFDRGGKAILPDEPVKRECQDQSACFLAGDLRATEQPYLSAVHILFVREHNRIAQILSRLNPAWDQERVYQEAKRILNAEWQHMVYNEFLPIVLGPEYLRANGIHPLSAGSFSSNYRDDFDPRVANEFASAAFRFGHSLIPTQVRIKKMTGSLSTVPLRQTFMNSRLVKDFDGTDDLVRGMLDGFSQTVDSGFVQEITEFLFAKNGIGEDLIAFNIQRSRDHGVPGYASYRRLCSGFPVRSFDDLGSNILPNDISRLRSVYSNVEDVDLFVGLLMEKPNPRTGAIVGDTLLCLIGDQFKRLRWGDRFFYDLAGQAGSFTGDQLNEIKKASFARLICDNIDSMNQVQPMALISPGNRNPLSSCESATIPFMSYSPWQE